MNARVIESALTQIKTGVSQYMAYIKEIDTISAPLDLPKNTSTYGNKIEKNNKIGIN